LMRAADPGATILEMMGSSDGAVLPVEPGAVIVKVCGVVREDDARQAIAAGANLIGIIFAKSKRQISSEQAQIVVREVRRFGERTAAITTPATASECLLERCGALRKACRRTPLVVGVFMDQPLEEVTAGASASGVDAVQLHGGEDVEYVAKLRISLPGVWLIKVVHLPPQAEANATDSELQALRDRLGSYGAVCDALLLDTAVKGSSSGGTGAAFDWKVARRVQEEWKVPVIVAGGLNDGNVAELVAAAAPFGVDVASGVEDAPGEKNADKTSAYVRNAKRARLSGS